MPQLFRYLRLDRLAVFMYLMQDNMPVAVENRLCLTRLCEVNLALSGCF